MEHAELIETAGVNYLTNLDPATYQWPDSLKNSTGDGWRIFKGESDAVKDGQCIQALVEGDLSPEEPPGSGNRWANLRLTLRTPTKVATDDETKLNLPAALKNHSQAADVLESAISVNGIELFLTAAVAGFTVWGLAPDRAPYRHQTENYWESGWQLRLLSCPSEFFPDLPITITEGILTPTIDSSGAIVYQPWRDTNGQLWRLHIVDGILEKEAIAG